MNAEASNFFSNVFEGKSLNLTEENIRDAINKDPHLFEKQTIQLANRYFQNWSENLLHFTNENLFDTAVDYFSKFTKVIDIIPSYFASDSQIFLFIVQSFLNNFIKNTELMKNFRLSFCFKLQCIICSNNNSIDYSQIDLVITIFKSFHITDTILEEIRQYPFNFSKDLKYDPGKEVEAYAEISFIRYILTQKIMEHILISINNKDYKSNKIFLQKILHKIFNQLITAKMDILTVNVNPPLGKLLSTPFISWIFDEYNLQKSIKDDTNNYEFNISQLYEACASYIYDEILKFTLGKNDDIGNLLYLIESLSKYYTCIFESTPGAMNYLESSIREALNDPRMKFSYNLAFYIDFLLSQAFLLAEPFWQKFVTTPPKEEKSENDDCCCCRPLFASTESLARSALLHAVMRIENKTGFCKYLADSMNSLTAAHGSDIIEIVRPVFDVVQLATDSNVLSIASGAPYEAHSCQCHHHHEHDHCHHHNNHDNDSDNDNYNYNDNNNHNNSNDNENSNINNFNSKDNKNNSNNDNNNNNNNNYNDNNNNNNDNNNNNSNENNNINNYNSKDNNNNNNNNNDNDNNNNNNNIINHNKHIHDTHEHCHCHDSCCSSTNNRLDMWVEARLEFQGCAVPVFCDFLTFQIVSSIIERRGCTLDELDELIGGDSEAIENRVITLSDYLLLFDEESGKYILDSSYKPDFGFIRIAPFYEAMKGQLDESKERLVEEKLLVVIKTKGSESLDFFIYDSFLMLNRKVRPDTAMILDAIDALADDGKIIIDNDIVKYVEEKEEEEENKE